MVCTVAIGESDVAGIIGDPIISGIHYHILSTWIADGAKPDILEKRRAAAKLDIVPVAKLAAPSQLVVEVRFAVIGTTDKLLVKFIFIRKKVIGSNGVQPDIGRDLTRPWISFAGIVVRTDSPVGGTKSS